MVAAENTDQREQLNRCEMASLGGHRILLEEQAIQMDSAPASLSSLNLQEAGSLASSVQAVEIDTPYGPLHVTVQGDRHKPAIVTCHDLGFNHCSSFMSFLAQPAMSALSLSFCWYHIDTPGQEPDADKFPDDYMFPTMTQLAEQVEYMADHFQLATMIGVGVGCGADILARYAMLCPPRVRGLVLINSSLQGSDWASPTWLFSKLAVWLLKGKQMEDGIPQLALSSLLNHGLGPGASGEATRIFRDSVSCQDPHNLSLFLHSFLSRSTIATGFTEAARCECLFICSGNYQAKPELVKLVSQMAVNRATLLEIPSTSGLVLLEEPGKVATALCYFLQGLGLVPTQSSPLLQPSHLLPLQTHSLPLQSAA